jgi:hypothetical protein
VTGPGLVLGALFAAALTSVVLSGPMVAVAAPVAAGAVVVTPAQALAIGRAYFAGNTKANAHLDRALQDTLEGGSAAYMDDATFRLYKQAGLPGWAQHAVTKTRVYVPRQTGYPAIFALSYHEVVSGKVSADTDYSLFRKGSSTDRWRVVSEPWIASGDRGDPVPSFTVDEAGYIPALTTSALMMSPSEMYKAWLRLQKLASEQAPIPAEWSQRGAFLWYYDTAGGDGFTDTFTATAWAPLCLAAKSGALCFTSTAQRQTWRLFPSEVAAGLRLTVKTAQDRANSGGVPDGSYIGFKTLLQAEAAIFIPTKARSGGLLYLGGTHSPISGTGIEH